ncbi:MAG TPA: beta-ketoacyl-[acyl-carrier-protein] synthase family protein [Rhodanobacteraceae bacterium]
MDEGVVITGIGAITPIGNTWTDTWAALKRGESGVAPITQFDASGFATTIAGEVKGFQPEAHFNTKVLNGTSRTSQLAMVAAREAVADAGLTEQLPKLETGVALNCAVSGFAEVERATETLRNEGPHHVRASVVPAAITNMPACEVAMDLGAHGPVNASALACASGAYAMLEARAMLLAGDADVVLAGGADAAITPVMFASLSQLHALSRRNDDPTAASRPFDADRDGFVFGEGAVVLTLERRSHAAARGATIYAEVRGGALTCDAFHVVAPDHTGRYATRAITRALAGAGLNPGDIDYVCAHGTSTRVNDRMETIALKQALGAAAKRLAVSAPKSMTGHMIGAAGALASAICAQAIREGVIPPTINYRTPDPECDLDYVPLTARDLKVRHALTNAFGFGGQNCVVAFGAA